MPSKNVVDRFSKIEKRGTALVGNEVTVVTQESDTTKKTVNVATQNIAQAILAESQGSGYTDFITLGEGLVGEGNAVDPIKVDPEWLEANLLRRDTLPITKVGNRTTRLLPISRTKLSTDSQYNSVANNFPPCAAVEVTGELKIVQAGTLAYTISIGDWFRDGDSTSMQIIERGIRPSSLDPAYRITDVTGKSATSAILATIHSETGQTVYWFAELTEGSLSELSYVNLLKIGTPGTNTLAGLIHKNSASSFIDSTGKYILTTVASTDANAGAAIRCFRVQDINASTGVVNYTEITSWTITSYAGLFSAQSNIKLSDKFAGASTEKCELVNTANASIGFPLGGSRDTYIQIVQNSANSNDVYLRVRREKLVGGLKYSADIVLKLTLSAYSGTAIAIGSYVSGKPTATLSGSTVVFNNTRWTFKTNSIGCEVVTLLEDGSLFIASDSANGGSSNYYLMKSNSGETNISMLDLHANSTKLAAAESIDIKPKYGSDISSTKKFYIASPIRATINGVTFTINPAIYDVANIVDAAPVTTLTNVPYGEGRFSGISVKAVYLYVMYYANATGGYVNLSLTHGKIDDAVDSALVAVLYYPTDGSASILIAQAFTRIGKTRLSYSPQGSSAPVSYDHPAQYPKSLWGGQTPTVQPFNSLVVASNTTTTALTEAYVGDTVYVLSLIYDLPATAVLRHTVSLNGGTQTQVGNGSYTVGSNGTLYVPYTVSEPGEYVFYVTEPSSGVVVSTRTLSVIESPVSEIIIDSSYGGTTEQVDGYYIKNPVDLWYAYKEKFNREPKADETINVIVESNVAVVSRPQGWATTNPGYLDSLSSGNYEVIGVINAKRSALVGYLGYSSYAFKKVYSRSEISSRNTFTDVFTTNFGGAHGTLSGYFLALWRADASVTIKVTKADGTVSFNGKVTDMSGGAVISRFTVDVPRGSTCEITIYYKLSNMNSNNESGVSLHIGGYNATLNPAILIPGYFLPTTKINMEIRGLVLGSGGSGLNMSAWDSSTTITDDFERFMNGSDGLVNLSNAVVDVTVSGLLGGGGGSSMYVSRDGGRGGFLWYYFGSGGAPFGLPGVGPGYFNVNMNDRHGPNIYGTAGGLLSGGKTINWPNINPGPYVGNSASNIFELGLAGGDIGECGLGVVESSRYVNPNESAGPGYAYRGNNIVVRTAGSGAIKGITPGQEKVYLDKDTWYAEPYTATVQSNGTIIQTNTLKPVSTLKAGEWFVLRIIHPIEYGKWDFKCGVVASSASYITNFKTNGQPTNQAYLMYVGQIVAGTPVGTVIKYYISQTDGSDYKEYSITVVA